MENLKNLPEIALRKDVKLPPNFLETYTKKYGSNIVNFAIWWAYFMEKEFRNFKEIEECVTKCASLAKKKSHEKITDCMQLDAICFLHAVWKHSEKIYRWRENIIKEIRETKEKYEQKESVENVNALSFAG